MAYGDHYPEIQKANGGYTCEKKASGTVSGIYCKKYVCGSSKDNAKITSGSTPINTYMLRLAEVYLIYAEAILGNNPSTDDTLQQVDGVIHNTKRINRLSTEKEMIPLAEAVMQTEAILEEWIPKEQLQGENYDLRVVCRESEIDYIVVRCSKGSITNLHLNNKAHWWNELSLPEVVRQQIYFQCQEAVQSLDLQYAGVDVLIERGTDIPYIIEVNGQGDHVYQDMFAHNSIYIQQIKNIKKRYNHANR